MVGELLCPDCGGIVGARAATDAGYPCKCFTADTPAGLSHRMDDAMSETAMGETAVGDTAVVEPAKPKICRNCGKDVAGHRRVKDSAGYLCYSCAKAEEKKELGDRVKCKLCGHLVRESTIRVYEGTKMCSKCYGERMELKKQKIQQIGIMSARSRAEFTQLQKLLFLGGVLLFIIVVSTWYATHGHAHGH